MASVQHDEPWWLYPPVGQPLYPGEGVSLAEALAAVLQADERLAVLFLSAFGNAEAKVEGDKVIFTLNSSMKQALMDAFPQKDEAA